jgi:hypothetical protein
MLLTPCASLSYAARYIQQRVALLKQQRPLMRRNHQRNKQTGILHSLWSTDRVKVHMDVPLG